MLVVDDGTLNAGATKARRPPKGAGNGDGHGVLGMAERAAAFDGTLVAGLACRRGWQVAVTPGHQGARPLVTIRVLLVDDQALLRKGFRMILEAEQDISVIGEASDGLAVVRLVSPIDPTSC